MTYSVPLNYTINLLLCPQLQVSRSQRNKALWSVYHILFLVLPKWYNGTKSTHLYCVGITCNAVRVKKWTDQLLNNYKNKMRSDVEYFSFKKKGVNNQPNPRPRLNLLDKRKSACQTIAPSLEILSSITELMLTFFGLMLSCYLCFVSCLR